MSCESHLYVHTYSNKVIREKKMFKLLRLIMRKSWGRGSVVLCWTSSQDSDPNWLCVSGYVSYGERERDRLGKE